ncbi:retron-type reverse transcriptase [Vibrio crassostreae]|uniref:reverse transcriptase domain-containing protein n=1 Tax=Vibrio crassostreae TaxID=246167 RepID=UPI001198E30A|nr:reverse transcriptase domain-containing protein [Vibrio crassostreae]TWD35030.1 retron-type reverse transcriptase [Vibrio crassostreae]
MQAYEVMFNYFNKDSLTDIYYKYIHYSPSTGVDGIKANDKYDIDKEVELIVDKVLNGRYKFSKYKEKLISKGANKLPRVISIPTVRDRIVIKALHLTLQEIFPECASTLIPQLMLNNISGQIKEYRFESFIKIDIKEFYPSLDHKILEEKLSQKIRTKALKNILFSAIKNPTGTSDSVKGVPQGLSISNILAEIYINSLDQKYSNNLKFKFNRYVDDLLVLSVDDYPKDLLLEIISDFKALGLDCHPYDEVGSKTKIGRITSKFDFLGYGIENRKLTVKEENVQRVENSIARIIHGHKYISKASEKITQYKLNLRVTGCVFEGKRRGWLFYYSQMEEHEILYRLDSTVNKLLKQAKLNQFITPKKFSKAFYECSRNNLENHNYITNFDGYSINEKRRLLKKFMEESKVNRLDDKIVDALYKKRVRYLVRDLEEDIRNNS